MATPAYQKSREALLREFDVAADIGLTDEEAVQRQQQYGKNTLIEKKKQSLAVKVLLQFKNVMVLILVAASLVSAVLGEYLDALVILAIILINAILGVVQEGRAEKAIEALKKMTSPQARVLRQSQQRLVDAADLVPGDLVLLEAGDIVPADLRLLESQSLKAEESSLTGESVAVEKQAADLIEEVVQLGDRTNMVYMSTAITYGKGTGLVVATASQTELGKIADHLQNIVDSPTPLQRGLDQLGKWLGIICLVVCLIIFGMGIIQGGDWLHMFMIAVSLAVAAIPEGLPAVVTIVLALGMKRMASRNAIVKKLLAVETLGCVDVICSDKTGTLTQNEMTVTHLYTDAQLLQLSGIGYKPEGALQTPDGVSEGPQAAMTRLLEIGLLCNDAQLVRDEQQEDNYSIIGDPTEGALVVAAAKAGLLRQDLEQRYPRVADQPFDSERKMMSTYHSGFSDAPLVSLTKGAPDIIIARCSQLMTTDGVRPLSAEDRDKFKKINNRLASEALRILAFAYARHPEGEPEGAEDNMTLVGLMGMIDQARPEAREAIKLCRQAGIRAMMITGDYQETAVAIARNLKLMQAGDEILNGGQIDQLSDEQLRTAVEKTSVFARVSPDHKVRIVLALKENKHVASMTGDGVNDALALKSADIGVAMGITGTDVAKNTADMILTDDNFATIVQAIKEGRIIYSNIRKFVSFLLSCNVGEILVIGLTTLILGPANVPLLPIQLLWLNLVTDSFPALALGQEAGEPDIMSRQPRKQDEPILNRPMIGLITTQSLAIFVSIFAAFLIGRGSFAQSVGGNAMALGRTYAFTTLILAELIRAFSARSEHIPVFRLGIFSNRTLNKAVLFSAALLLAVVYVPFLGELFKTVPIAWNDWLIIIPLAVVPFAVAEIGKVIRRVLKK